MAHEPSTFIRALQTVFWEAQMNAKSKKISGLLNEIRMLRVIPAHNRDQKQNKINRLFVLKFAYKSLLLHMSRQLCYSSH